MSFTVNEAAVRDVLATLMPAWAPHEVRRIAYLPGGYTNRNYRVEVRHRRYVLRVVERARPRPHEHAYLDLDVAPDVVAYDAERGHLLTRWIDGRILADSPPSPVQAGEYLADLHARVPIGLHRYDFAREVTAMFRQAIQVDAGVQACFERIGWQPVEWRGCHNDLNPWNIIRAEGADDGPGYRTLDWESAGDNDPLFDLVGLCVGLGWGLREAQACHEVYRQGRPGIGATESRLRDTFRAFLIREYAWAAAQLAIGNDRGEIRSQVATSRAALADWC